MSLSISLFTLTVPTHQRALAYRDGRLDRVLEPGRHRRRRRTRLVLVDVRERLVTLAPQEVVTSDGVSLRATVAVRCRVVDPVAFHEVAADPEAVVYLAAQLGLREAMGTLEVDTVLGGGRRELAVAVTEAARAAGRTVGVEVVDAVVKDVMLPPELRAAYAELVAARQRGRARLEAARAETAALRSLANGAALLEQNPALARLRFVEALPVGSTVTVTLDR